MTEVDTQIPKTMKALVVPEAGSTSYELRTVPVPSPSPNQILLKIGAAGLCHTDLMVMDGSFGECPVIGSHEPAGTIVQLGEEVKKEGKVKVGERVAALLPRDICGKCADCTEGDWKYCAYSKYGGITTDGFFAEYALVEGKTCVSLPDTISFDQAAPLTCAGITIYAAIKKAVKYIPPNGILAISGLGALGHLGVQMAKAMGIKVVGIDARPEPIEMVKSFPSQLQPDILIDASKISADEVTKQVVTLREEGYVGWDGADVVILTADAIPAQEYLSTILRRHGHYIIVAQPTEVKFNFKDFIFKDITVSGSLHGNQSDLQETIDLCAKFGIKSNVSTFNMDDHEKMLESVHHNGRKGKSVLVF